MAKAQQFGWKNDDLQRVRLYEINFISVTQTVTKTKRI